MHPSIFVALFLLLAVPEAYGTPLEDLFEQSHSKPVKLYQCFRNATTFEDPSAVDLNVVWYAKGLPDNKANNVVSYSKPGSPGKTTFYASAQYVAQGDYATLTGEGLIVELYQLRPPYNGKGYYIKQIVTSSGLIAIKIFDTSPTCESAEALREQVCPDPCSMKPTRKNQSP